MLSLGPGVRIVLAPEPVDLSGQLFVFFGRRMDRVKVLFFSAGGFVIHYKRLERGRFTMPHVPAGATHVTLDAASLPMLLEGVDLRAVRRTSLWQPQPLRA